MRKEIYITTFSKERKAIDQYTRYSRGHIFIVHAGAQII